MIAQLAKKTASFFSDNDVIKPEDAEAYAYGLEILYSTAANFIVMILIAVVTHSVIAIAVYMAAFLTLRINAGGYHADTHIACVSILAAVLLIFTAVIKLMPAHVFPYAAVLVMVAADIPVLLYAPVEHPNHPLKEKQAKRLRRSSLIFLGIWTVLCFAFIFPAPAISFYMACGAVTAAGALIAEKLKQGHGKTK
ncbi:MAG: accessory gene regulator B family protein [Oscillospiraceae bacterium]|nr:accessory gene regulator B family protein [Oscillospiraceae bacterium]